MNNQPTTSNNENDPAVEFSETLRIGFACSWSTFFPNSIDADIVKKDQAAADPNRLATDWQTLMEGLNVSPSYSDDVEYYIQCFLGYVPSAPIWLPHGPFVRNVLEQYDKNLIDRAKAYDELVFHIKQIRNDDLKKHSYNYYKLYDERDYQLYNSFLPHLKEKAHERLKALIGDAVKLEYSIYAELLLRYFLQYDDMTNSCTPLFTPPDFKALTMYFYRWNYLVDGETAADHMPLFADTIISQK